MNDNRTFVIPRTTGTHGDVFAAVGLADLLSGASDSPVHIREAEAGFEISAILVDAIPQEPGYPFLKANENVKVPPGVTDFVDYKAEKAKSDRRKKLTAGKSKKSLGPEIEELLKQDQPRPDWPLLQALNPNAYKTANRVAEAIYAMKPHEFNNAIESALREIADSKPSGLDFSATTVQLFSPNAAKGYSRLKPDSTDRNDKTKEQWKDDFIEWLRYRGYRIAAWPFFRGSDLRVLCPIPNDISCQTLRQVCLELRQIGIPGGPPKLDSLTTLKIAELLITHSQEYNRGLTTAWGDNSLFGKTPADIISGISVTHYQSLGNERAVFAMAILAIPGWVVLNSDDDALGFLAILDEHQRVVRSLQDDHSDEIGLLILYRRFLEFRGETSILTLIDFMARYGSLVLREPRRTKFSTGNFERLLMQNAPTLTPVLNDPGFQAVAAAIRNATVSAQAQKAMNRPDYREIRYDLLPELRRKSSLPGNDPLIQALSDFISQYNVENARRRELNRAAPRNITTDEFSSLVALIETRRAATVGPMLCAYGSCRISRDRDEPKSDSSQATSNEED